MTSIASSLAESGLAGSRNSADPVVSLANANLTGADLAQVDDLQGGDLTEADLTGADLTGADFSEADLEGATGVTVEELEEQAATLEAATIPDGTEHD